ncbi:MAG: M23 family metallopeptidase [Treponema sp.]|jgi:murein DD-endopeptidase MepM/ murein hydrolase activator NlpD|nr:M23 family metallopeptidase [Treponema sp.]
MKRSPPSFPLIFGLVSALFLLGTARPALSQTPKIAVLPDNPRLGEPLTVALTGYPVKTALPHREFRAVLKDGNGRRLSQALFFEFADVNPPLFTALLTLPSTTGADFASIDVEDRGALIVSAPINIQKREFIRETIELDQNLSDIRAKPDPLKAREAAQLWAILSHTGTDIWAADAFIPPIKSTRRTGFFGDRRIFRYADGSTDTSIHAGIDYGVPTGTEVGASASGKVVLARLRIVTGYSVVVEHLPGVYSLYYHLSRIDVSEGSMVKQGGRLGLSGATGLATGPHLHWEIRVSGENTDPDALIARPLLDKNAILSKLYGISP